MGASIDGLGPELQEFARDLDDAVFKSGLQGRFTSTLRSRSEQERLYRAFLSGRNPFPVAPPGFSAHEYGTAFDYVVTPQENQADVGAYWRSLGGVWAGDRDFVHFELPGASAAAKAAGRLELEQSQDNGEKPPWYLDAVKDVLSIGPWWSSFLGVDLSGANILNKGSRALHHPMCAIFGGNWC